LKRNLDEEPNKGGESRQESHLPRPTIMVSEKKKEITWELKTGMAFETPVTSKIRGRS